MKNNCSPVTVVWPSVVLFITPCSTTSGLISTDVPHSCISAFNEEGTRTHTAPTHNRRMSDEHGETLSEKEGEHSYCRFTFLTVELGAATVSHMDVNGPAVRGNLKEAIRTICRRRNGF